MDFINYLIDTKNYSALKAVRDYQSEVRTFTTPKLGKKAKIGLATTAAAAATATAAINPHTSRAIRRWTGNETEFDKAHAMVDEKIPEEYRDRYHDALQDMEDSKFGRDIKEKEGISKTIRDRWNDLTGKRTRMDDIADKYHYGKDQGLLDQYRMSRDMAHTFDEDDDDTNDGDDE